MGTGGAVARRLIEGDANRLALSNIRHDASGGRINAEAELPMGPTRARGCWTIAWWWTTTGAPTLTGRPRASATSSAPTPPKW